ncbi:MAG: hypothetical protein ACP5VC_05815 [Bryobacteraceae bacterium]
MRSWKPVVFALTLAVPAALPAQQPEGPSGYEITATSRGSFIAWPTGTLARPEAMALAEKAEASLAEPGSVPETLVAEIAARTREAGRGLPDSRAHSAAPGQGRGLVVRTALVQVGAACSAARRVCTDSAGAPCAAGQPGCYCGCVNPNESASTVSAALRNRRLGAPRILSIPEGAALPDAAASVSRAMTLGFFWLKLHGNPDR